jgi:outer membrane protein OmpA-like peptidoglycan-associated protein
MNKIILTFLILFGFSLSLFAQIKYDVDYNSISNDWSIYNDANYKTSYTGSCYRIEHLREQGSYNFWKSVPIYYEKDFTIESAISQIDGVENMGYGLLFGCSDANNMYAFTISSTGQFLVFKFESGKYYTLKGWQVSDKIKPMRSQNIIKISQKNKRLGFYINNSLVWDTTALAKFGNNIGFNLSNKMSIEIDYLKAEYDTSRILLPANMRDNSKKENLGENVNSKYEELMPVIAADGRTVYFSVRNHPENYGTDHADDIWFSTFDNGNWSKSRKLDPPLNTPGNNALIAITPDGNNMYLFNVYNAEGTNVVAAGLSVSQKTSTGWTIPKEIKIDNYYNNHQFSEFSINPEKNVVIFALQRKETYGEKDLYISFLKDGKFTEPKNLGPVLNTTRSEITPFLASDNATLYFSSHGHPGYGNADVFMSKRLDDTWLNWSEPINLGKGINTVNWDAYYTIPASGDYVYFISNETKDGSSDLFRIELPDAAKPNPVVLIKGKIIDTKTKKPISAEIIYNNLKNDEYVGSASSDPATGEYKIVLPCGKNYSFMANKKNYYPISDNIDVTEIKTYKEIERDLYLTPIEIGEKVRLNNIFFDYDKSTLKVESYPELKRLIDLFKDYPNLKIEVSGHTDNIGNQDYNKKLSNERANSVMTYLISKGIQKSKISATGFGKTQPVADNSTDDGRAMNRRVEFKILEK